MRRRPELRLAARFVLITAAAIAASAWIRGADGPALGLAAALMALVWVLGKRGHRRFKGGPELQAPRRVERRWVRPRERYWRRRR